MEVVLEHLAVSPVEASARMTGKYSGLAPAITAFTATFSTVYSQNSRNDCRHACGPPPCPADGSCP